MTIEEARAHAGRAVIYRPLDAKPGRREERGVIVRAGTELVFVRYGKRADPQPTLPAALHLVEETL